MFCSELSPLAGRLSYAAATNTETSGLTWQIYFLLTWSSEWVWQPFFNVSWHDWNLCFPVISAQKKELRPTLHCFPLEATDITSPHGPLTSISHMVPVLTTREAGKRMDPHGILGKHYRQPQLTTRPCWVLCSSDRRVDRILIPHGRGCLVTQSPQSCFSDARWFPHGLLRDVVLCCVYIRRVGEWKV